MPVCVFKIFKPIQDGPFQSCLRQGGGRQKDLYKTLTTNDIFLLPWMECIKCSQRNIQRLELVDQNLLLFDLVIFYWMLKCQKGSAFAGIIEISLCYLKHCQKCILIFQPTLMNSLKALFAFYLLKIVGIINAVAPKTQKANTTITSNKNSQKYNLKMRKNLKNGNQTSRFWRMIFLIRFNLHIGKKHKSPCLQPLLGRMESVKKLL